MDEYPPGSLDHNVPFLVVSGLGTTPTKPPPTDPELRERGILVRSELPPVDTRESRIILRLIQEAGASGLAWASRDNPKRYRFRISTIGRVCDYIPMLWCGPMLWSYDVEQSCLRSVLNVNARSFCYRLVVLDFPTT